MICHFLLLEAPIRSCKQFENSPASVKSMIQFIKPVKMRFPSQKELSPAIYYCPPTQISKASATARSSCLAAVAEFRGKC